MAKNKISDLRDHLFEVIEKLQNNSDPKASDNEKIDIKNAETIAQVAQTIVNAAKLELDYLKLVDKSNGTAPLSVFIDSNEIKKIGN